MTQMQLEYQKLLETKRRNDQEILESQAQTQKTKLEYKKVLAEAEKALQQAVTEAYNQGYLQVRMETAPLDAVSNLIGSMGSLIGGGGKLISAL